MDLACEMALKMDHRLTTRSWLAEQVQNVEWKLKAVKFYDGVADELYEVCICFSLQKIKFTKKII